MISENAVAYYGHHKCATRFIRRIVRDVVSPLPGFAFRTDNDHFEFDGKYEFDSDKKTFWSFLNADYLFVRDLDIMAFHVVRDPRDIVVSAYFSHLYSHPVEGWAKLQKFRPYLASLSKEDGIMREMEFIGPLLYRMLTWDYSNSHILEITFEELVKEPLAVYIKIFRHLGFDEQAVPARTIAAAINRRSFEKLSGGRTPGVEDEKSHYRKGVPGDWKNHMTDKNIAYFKSLYNPLLLKLGYESVENWQV